MSALRKSQRPGTIGVRSRVLDMNEEKLTVTGVRKTRAIRNQFWYFGFPVWPASNFGLKAS